MYIQRLEGVLTYTRSALFPFPFSANYVFLAKLFPIYLLQIRCVFLKQTTSSIIHGRMILLLLQAYRVPCKKIIMKPVPTSMPWKTTMKPFPMYLSGKNYYPIIFPQCDIWDNISNVVLPNDRFQLNPLPICGSYFWVILKQACTTTSLQIVLFLVSILCTHHSVMCHWPCI